MAKKRKKQPPKEEEYEFVPPSFDEKEFLRKELRDTRTVFLTIGYAVAFGLAAGFISYVSTALVGVAFLLGIVGIFSLKYVYPLLNVDISEFKKKNWAGSVAWFFLTFLAVWVLMFNFPIADFADPDVSDIVVWVERGDNLTAIEYKYVKSEGDYIWVPLYNEDLSTVIRATENYTLNITAHVADNGKLASAMIMVTGVHEDYVPMTDEGDSRYGYTLSATDIASSGLRFSIYATDSEGNEVEFSPGANLPPIPVMP